MSATLSEQLTRKKPMAAKKGPHAGPDLNRGFGTFQLTAEGIDDPIRDLEEARRANGIPASRFRVLDFGESMRVTGR